jgi:branched-subunit amino acid transport protein AzlD
LLQLFLKDHAAGKRELIVRTPGSLKQLMLFFGAMVLVTFFFNRLGYPLSSFLLMVALLRILGVKRWRLNLPLSFIAATVCYFLFVQWLKIPLPKGWIGI